MSGKPTVISTFAGCGGSSLGYKWAGFDELLAIDFEPHAVETFRLNFPDVDVWQADIRQVTSEAILARCNIKQGELDVLDGSPPCQGFSTAGKRVVNDTRNDLAWEFIRLIEGLKPRAFVMENVSGMANGGMRGRFNQILAGLKATGYRVEVRKLNAMYYGVPQSRERIIFIGMRDRQEIKWPARQGLVGCERLDDRRQRYSERRYGDSIAKEGLPVATITKIGRIFWDRLHELGVKSYTFAASFPTEFKWIGSHQDIKARIGNAVPPKMMQAIAECVKEVLDE